jgi:DNA-binding transcriptional MerR regulator/effector-binding domain-containing protein
VTATLSIGEFSKLTHLSIKALRHYHDVGLLVPAAIDDTSRYRRYGVAQAPDALLIRRLRELDMPLDKIRDVVGADDAEQRNATIAAHLTAMETELERTRTVVASLRGLLEHPAAAGTVERRVLPAVTALALSADVTRHHVESWCGAAFGELWDAAAATDSTIVGHGGGMFSSLFFADDAGPVTAYLPVAEAPSAFTGRVEVIEVPAAHVLVATHVGPFAELDRTYAALGAAAHVQGVATDGAIRELYVVGPNVTDDPQQFVTEVCWPVYGQQA